MHCNTYQSPGVPLRYYVPFSNLTASTLKMKSAYYYI